MNKEALFEHVFGQLKQLSQIWNDYYKEPYHDLSSFDGFSQMYYLSPSIINEALEIININYSKKGHQDLTVRINKIKADFEEMFSLFGEYLNGVPDIILTTAIHTSKFFDTYCEGVDDYDVEDLASTSIYLENCLK